jgi:hypothetical protein
MSKKEKMLLYLEKATNIPQENSDVKSDSLRSEESFDQILYQDSDDESNSFECNDGEFFEKENYNHNIENICLNNPKKKNCMFHLRLVQKMILTAKKRTI